MCTDFVVRYTRCRDADGTYHEKGARADTKYPAQTQIRRCERALARRSQAVCRKEERESAVTYIEDLCPAHRQGGNDYMRPGEQVLTDIVPVARGVAVPPQSDPLAPQHTVPYFQPGVPRPPVPAPQPVQQQAYQQPSRTGFGYQPTAQPAQQQAYQQPSRTDLGYQAPYTARVSNTYGGTLPANPLPSQPQPMQQQRAYQHPSRTPYSSQEIEQMYQRPPGSASRESLHVSPYAPVSEPTRTAASQQAGRTSYTEPRVPTYVETLPAESAQRPQQPYRQEHYGTQNYPTQSTYSQPPRMQQPYQEPQRTQRVQRPEEGPYSTPSQAPSQPPQPSQPPPPTRRRSGSLTRESEPQQRTQPAAQSLLPSASRPMPPFTSVSESEALLARWRPAADPDAGSSGGGFQSSRGRGQDGRRQRR